MSIRCGWNTHDMPAAIRHDAKSRNARFVGMDAQKKRQHAFGCARTVIVRRPGGARDAMKIALLADLHANLAAVQACLAHARSQGAQGYAFLGDLVGYGPEPA